MPAPTITYTRARHPPNHLARRENEVRGALDRLHIGNVNDDEVFLANSKSGEQRAIFGRRRKLPKVHWIGDEGDLAKAELAQRPRDQMPRDRNHQIDLFELLDEMISLRRCEVPHHADQTGTLNQQHRRDSLDGGDFRQRLREALATYDHEVGTRGRDHAAKGLAHRGVLAIEITFRHQQIGRAIEKGHNETGNGNLGMTAGEVVTHFEGGGSDRSDGADTMPDSGEADQQLVSDHRATAIVRRQRADIEDLERNNLSTYDR